MLDRGVTEPSEPSLSATLAPAEHEGLLRATNKKRWKPVWKQRLVVGTLVLADVFLALVVWGRQPLARASGGVENFQRSPLRPSCPA